MILSDTDILSALAKVEQLDSLYQLLRIEKLYIVPAVLNELEEARRRQHSFSHVLFEHLEAHHIVLVALTPSELAFAASLHITLDNGERESMAVAYQRNGTLLSNESRVAHWSRHFNIKYLNLPMLLRAFWTESVLTQEEVRQLIAELKIADRMGFSARTLANIF
jgi:predicted nucleic acid-binding protein